MIYIYIYIYIYILLYIGLYWIALGTCLKGAGQPPYNPPIYPSLKLHASAHIIHHHPASMHLQPGM